LSTRAPFPKPQPFQSRTSHFIPLSWFILWTIDRPIFLVKELSKNEEKGKLYDQVNLEPLLPLLSICLTKVRMFWETIKLFFVSFF